MMTLRQSCANKLRKRSQRMFKKEIINELPQIICTKFSITHKFLVLGNKITNNLTGFKLSVRLNLQKVAL